MPPGPQQRAEPRVEKRVFFRLLTELPVRYRIMRGGHALAGGDGAIVNLSSGGMLLTARPFAEASLSDLFSGRAHLVVELPVSDGRPPIVTEAVLVWVEGAQGDAALQRYGFEFRAMCAADQQRLQDWIVSTCP